MGTNSKSSHQAYITEPAGAADGENGMPAQPPPSYQHALYLALGQGEGEADRPGAGPGRLVRGVRRGLGDGDGGCAVA